jgi:hypothetical protein
MLKMYTPSAAQPLHWTSGTSGLLGDKPADGPLVGDDRGIT